MSCLRWSGLASLKRNMRYKHQMLQEGCGSNRGVKRWAYRRKIIYIRDSQTYDGSAEFLTYYFDVY